MYGMPIARPKGKYRSTFEYNIAKHLRDTGVKRVKYEAIKLEYNVPSRVSKYTPDFILPNGIIIEAKGRFTASDRKKMVYVISDHPDKDIRMVFQNPNVKINKRSKTTYAMWCDKAQIKWGTIDNLKGWANE